MFVQMGIHLNKHEAVLQIFPEDHCIQEKKIKEATPFERLGGVGFQYLDLQGMSSEMARIHLRETKGYPEGCCCQDLKKTDEGGRAQFNDFCL